jgi:hypothetical protein
MSRMISALLLLTLAACASHPPEASGPWRALNPGRWAAAPSDLQEAPMPLSVARTPAQGLP